MGKESRRAKEPREKGKMGGEKANPLENVRVPRVMLSAAILVGLAWWLGGSLWARSHAEGRCAFPIRLFFLFSLESAFNPLCSALWLLPARWLAPRLPGAAADPSLPAKSAWPLPAEMTHNDESIVWPRPEHVPAEWAVLARGRKQPFFLNHVRGSMRLRHAAIRLGAATATVITMLCMSTLLDQRPLSEFGLKLEGAAVDTLLGAVTGTVCIVILFLIERRLGWIQPTHMFECVVPGESWGLNFLWDILFHIGVTLDEELQLRGWLLHATALACEAYLGSSRSFAMLLAAVFTTRAYFTLLRRCSGESFFSACTQVIESILFAFLHMRSPGASTLALCNLAIGGMAAALNVVLSGGLAFSFGWHFSWNLVMGHVLGLSTSGIPMSATLVSVVPHPSKQHLHGGTFGPEKSVLAPGIYLLGCVMLYSFYGWN